MHRGTTTAGREGTSGNPSNDAGCTAIGCSPKMVQGAHEGAPVEPPIVAGGQGRSGGSLIDDGIALLWLAVGAAAWIGGAVWFGGAL